MANIASGEHFGVCLSALSCGHGFENTHCANIMEKVKDTCMGSAVEFACQGPRIRLRSWGKPVDLPLRISKLQKSPVVNLMCLLLLDLP